MEVDWIGDTLKVYDSANYEIPLAIYFVAVLPCSLYSYAVKRFHMKIESLIEAHVHAYSFFERSDRILVPIILKLELSKIQGRNLSHPSLYHEMAEHYGTAIIPPDL